MMLTTYNTLQDINPAVLDEATYRIDGKIEYEFRTTLVPGMVGIEEIRSIAGQVKGARKYALQQFVPENARSATLRRKKPLPRRTVDAMADVLRPVVAELVLRGKINEETELLPGMGEGGE